jgi:hypothetical protein
MEDTAVLEQEVMNATQTEVPPVFNLGDLPEDVDDLVDLKDILVRKMSENVAPRGTLTLVRSINRYVHRKPLLDAAHKELKRTFDYVNGKRGNGAAKGGRVRSIRSLAHKFYDKMPEAAIRRHCVVNGLDYDSFETVDARIEALVEASAALV